MTIHQKMSELHRAVLEIHEPIDGGTYACDRCGRRDALDAVVNDELWLEINGRKEGVLCLWCMDELANKCGVGGVVELHFCGRALLGSSDVQLEELNDVNAVVYKWLDGEIDHDVAMSMVAKAVGISEPPLT